MSNRRQFLEQGILACGFITARTRGIGLWLRAAEERQFFPEGWEFFENEGHILFSVWNEAGDLTTNYVCYLIQKPHDGDCWYSISVTFSWFEIAAVDTEEGIKNLCMSKVNEAIGNFKPVRVDMNGGAFSSVKERL